MGLQLGKFVESRINAGMITTIDPADIPAGALQLAKNARVRFDKTTRRSGHSLFVPLTDVPNLRTLRLATLLDNSGSGTTFRFSPLLISRLTGGAWVTVTSGVGLTGGNDDRFKTVVINNRFVFANNGADVLQLIATDFSTYAALGNAPKYRYITGFYDRVVGANRTDGGSFNVEVGWSGLGNITEWNNAVDSSAGTTPLIESPDDFGDPITGLFGVANVLVTLREHSLFLGTKNPVASNPFNFYNAVPKIGCNAPWSAASYERGVIWFDARTSTVWLYEIGGGLEPIGKPIANEIIKNIDDPLKVFGSYNPLENEYIVCTPVVGSTLVKAWTFNLGTKAWTYDEIDNICSADDVDISSGYVSIDDLIGTIDGLGDVTIDSLSPAVVTRPTRAYGRLDGEILIEDKNTTLDGATEYVTEFESKLFEIPEDDMIVANIRIEIIANSAVDLNLLIAKNGGEFVQVKSFTIDEVNKTVLLQYNKQIRCRQIAWKLTGTGGIFHLVKYEIQVYETGKSKR